MMSHAIAPDSVIEMSKDVWLEEVRKVVSDPVCKSFMADEIIAEQMKMRSISFETCMSLVPKISENCEKQYYSSLPTTITDMNAEKWGQILGECIGIHFAMSYL
jgi:hypothetical protein